MIGRCNVGGGKSEGIYVWNKYTTKEIEIEIVDWATGTDAQIVAMVNAADNGAIDLTDYWSVGDSRTVSLSAMAATGVGESHLAQDVTLVLMNAGGKTLTTATSGGRVACSFIVGQKELLNYSASTFESGYMNSTATNSGSWSSSARRAWCNAVYYNAIPSTLRPIFKQFSNTTGVGGGASSGTQTTDDYFALPAEKEVFGSVSNSFSDEASACTQFAYYKTSSNRIKYYTSGSAYSWWERSPYSGNSNVFCRLTGNGSAYYDNADRANGVAPFGCI